MTLQATEPAPVNEPEKPQSEAAQQAQTSPTPTPTPPPLQAQPSADPSSQASQPPAGAADRQSAFPGSAVLPQPNDRLALAVATPMPTNPQHNQLQQQAAMAQSSPIVRNPTPMMASSPLMANSAAMNMGGFPMQPTASNQGAGSPPRPPSAMQHANIAMARQMSQQQSQSRHATPQMAHGTPHMTGSVPMDGNRQMSGTPQMQHQSPQRCLSITLLRLHNCPNDPTAQFMPDESCNHLLNSLTSCLCSKLISTGTFDFPSFEEHDTAYLSRSSRRHESCSSSGCGGGGTIRT